MSSPPIVLTQMILNLCFQQFGPSPMHAYDHGLNGRQAAWASRKYRRHRVLPNDILEELGKEGVM